ncbi:MAG TPA: FIST N-terminal domain-containing protein [Solirubrobacteraceae bacterium]|jgi:small ligand-binding sensory domain FIST
MAVQIGTGLSTLPDPLDAGAEAATRATAALNGGPQLVLAFATGAHLAAPEAMLQGVKDATSAPVLLGCGAGGVLGDRRELESGTAVAVWAGSFDSGEVTPFRLRFQQDDDPPTITGLPSLDRSRGVILIADPYSFPTDALLSELALQAPGVPVLGGLESARVDDDSAALLFGDEVLPGGAVGVSLEDIDLLPCVSQGAAPLGPELTITGAEGNVIDELAGRPALETLQRTVAQLTGHERRLIAGGLLIGIVVDAGKADYEQGDFLVRGVAGADPDSGRLAVAAEVREGQVIRLHARDARSAHDDLRQQLRLRMDAAGDGGPAGALVFSCNGRGAAMFGASDHDAITITEELGGAPAAGFFAAGEIGPVGGRSFLHGFTATVGVFLR